MDKGLASVLERELAGAERVVILAIGSEFHEEDSLALQAAKEIEEVSENWKVILAESAPENFTGVIGKASPSHVVFLDAAEMGEEPGSIEVIEKGRIVDTSFSTHCPSLSILAEYLTGEVGCKVIIIGIQGGESWLPDEDSNLEPSG